MHEEAERLFKRDRFAEAEELYVRVLRAEPLLRQGCAERLLAAYARLGRFDRAIATALAYRAWLNEQEGANRRRLRQLALQLGEFHLRLGHAREGLRHVEKATENGADPLPPVQQVAARDVAAAALGRLGRKEASDKLWDKVE